MLYENDKGYIARMGASDNELKHWKYISKKRGKNGKWIYTYPTSTKKPIDGEYEKNLEFNSRKNGGEETILKEHVIEEKVITEKVIGEEYLKEVEYNSLKNEYPQAIESGKKATDKAMSKIGLLKTVELGVKKVANAIKKGVAAVKNFFSKLFKTR